jgi:hypothetical protein
VFTFFLVVRALRAAFIALRAAAGMLIIGHGVYKWSQNRLK